MQTKERNKTGTIKAIVIFTTVYSKKKEAVMNVQASPAVSKDVIGNIRYAKCNGVGRKKAQKKRLSKKPLLNPTVKLPILNRTDS
jgi:hypothetical protein